MEKNIIIGSIPWPVAAVTAIWFGLMAYKARKNCVLWAIGGGLLGLVITTLVMGLGQAAFIPFSNDQQSMFRIKIAAVAVLIVLCIGWWFTGSLHPRLLAPWKRIPEAPKEAPKDADGALPAKPPATAPKR
jgi:hypothetical protein